MIYLSPAFLALGTLEMTTALVDSTMSIYVYVIVKATHTANNIMIKL